MLAQSLAVSENNRNNEWEKSLRWSSEQANFFALRTEFTLWRTGVLVLYFWWMACPNFACILLIGEVHPQVLKLESSDGFRAQSSGGRGTTRHPQWTFLHKVFHYQRKKPHYEFTAIFLLRTDNFNCITNRTNIYINWNFILLVKKGWELKSRWS